MRDDPRYLPTIEEIKERVRTTRLMRDNNFSTEFMESVMLYNSPTIETVQRLFKQTWHGGYLPPDVPVHV